MDDLVTRLAELSAKATPGEWEADGSSVIVKGSGAYVGFPAAPHGAIASLYNGEYIENPNAEADAAFITTLVNDYRSGELVPADRITAQAAEIERLREALDDTVVTMAVVRAASSGRDWNDNAQHLHDICGTSMLSANAALGSLTHDD